MSDFNDPSLEARPGKFYVDVDSAPWDDDVVKGIAYSDGTNLLDLMLAKYPETNPDLHPLKGKDRIKWG